MNPEPKGPQDVDRVTPPPPTADPAATAPGAALPGTVEMPSRQCGRCRGIFDGDPTLHPTALPEWWICPPCREALLGSLSRHR